MGEQRTCVMTSKQLSSDLGISREAARDRLKALAAITVGAKLAITVEKNRTHTYWPGRYHIRFSPSCPLLVAVERFEMNFGSNTLARLELWLSNCHQKPTLRFWLWP